LMRECLLSEEQLQSALDYQKTHRCRIGEAVLALQLCSEAQITRALSLQIGMPFVDLEETPPEWAALRLLTRASAQKYRVVPARKGARSLLVVARTPFDF